jgi:3-oxoacyl-[acyl-carrier protein] reductase
MPVLLRSVHDGCRMWHRRFGTDWSPDGQKIVFTSHDVTDNPRLSNTAEIYAFNRSATSPPASNALLGEHLKEASMLPDYRRRYEGKVVLVTGGGSGLGQAMSLSFGREGGRIAVVDIDGVAAAQTAESVGDARAYTCDVSDEAAVTATFRAVDVDLGPLDVLVNNAGTGAGRPEAAQHALAELRNLLVGAPGDSLRATSTLGLGVFRQTLRAHVYGTFLCAKEALRRMEDRRSGTILNMASIAGILGLPGSIDYAAAKGAIIAMTKSLAQEVVGAGIRVNAIAPGFIDTPMLSRTVPPELLQAMLMRVGMRRVGRPDEVAALALHLCSDEASYITGQVVSPNGGVAM